MPGSKEKKELVMIFEVEGSLRQGGGLSATIYGQITAKVIEHMEENGLGKCIESTRVPAIRWQDDMTGITTDKKELEKADENKIYFSSEDKCKVITVNERKGNKEEGFVRLGEIEVKRVNKVKVLGYNFNKEGNNKAHIEEKQQQITGMVANMGLSIKAMNMENMFGQSMLILHEKCFVPKLAFGLSGCQINKGEMEKIAMIEKNTLRSYLGLPKGTPKAALYIEFGVTPIKMELYKRKLMMWNRINREESNSLIKDIMKEQVKKELPWIQQLIKIGQEIEIDIIKGRKMAKKKWKEIIMRKIRVATVKELESEVERITKYREIAKDEIRVGEQKNYMSLPVKKAASTSIFRARANLLDPTPRKPYWDRVWKCKFCRAKTQDTQHYILECTKTSEIIRGRSKEELWRLITTLEGNKKEIEELAIGLQRLYKKIKK